MLSSLLHSGDPSVLRERAAELLQVKLTPGKQKRGKASKQAIEVFSRTRDTPASHKVLMKSVTDNECVAAMIGDVKVSVAGLAQATQVKRCSS